MYCLMCFSALGKLHRFQGARDDDTFIKIMFTFPELLIPESKEPVFICSTCLEQISLFYTIKKTSLQNSCRLIQFNAMLKGTNNFKCNDLNIIINSDVVSTKREHRIIFEVNPNSTYLLSLEDHSSTYIKEENNEYEHSQQLVNNETSLIQLQDCGTSRKKRKNSHVDGKDSTFTYNNEPKTPRESQKKQFKCTDCHKAFTTRSQLERHSRVHTGEKPYKCTTCHKTFKQPHSLNTHNLIHTGEKPHECDVCHKTFIQKIQLIYHKRNHNNVRPYKCTVCSKTFIISSNLIVHMLSHTGEKPHQCHLCEYKCAQAGHLKTHIRRHTGEKPYSCKYCEKSCTTTSDLKAHKRRLHSNEDSK